MKLVIHSFLVAILFWLSFAADGTAETVQRTTKSQTGEVCHQFGKEKLCIKESNATGIAFVLNKGDSNEEWYFANATGLGGLSFTTEKLGDFAFINPEQFHEAVKILSRAVVQKTSKPQTGEVCYQFQKQKMCIKELNPSGIAYCLNKGEADEKWLYASGTKLGLGLTKDSLGEYEFANIKDFKKVVELLKVIRSSFRFDAGPAFAQIKQDRQPF